MVSASLPARLLRRPSPGSWMRLLAIYPEARWHPVAGDLTRQCCKGRCARLRQAGRIGAETRRGGRHLRHRQRSLELRAGALALRSRLRLSPQSYAYAKDEPPLRRGADADADRIRRGPSLHCRAAMSFIRSSWRWRRESCEGSALSGPPDWVGKVVADLTANRGRALVHVGPDQPPETHALVHAINEKLGARGNTLDLIAPVAYAGRTRRHHWRTWWTTCKPGR